MATKVASPRAHFSPLWPAGRAWWRWWAAARRLRCLVLVPAVGGSRPKLPTGAEFGTGAVLGSRRGELPGPAHSSAAAQGAGAGGSEKPPSVRAS